MSAAVQPSACRPGRVVRRERVGSFFVLELDVPGWTPGVPGQFAMVRPEGSTRFLPRPLSLHRQKAERLSFLVSPIGPGTRGLGAVERGDVVWVEGPLGRGFDLAAMAEAGAAAAAFAASGSPPSPSLRLVVVAGGVGVAPFVHLLDELVFVDRDTGEAEPAGYGFDEVLVLLGFRDTVQAEAAWLFEGSVEALRRAGIATRVEIIAEDGSLGRCGLVTSLLEEEIRPGDSIASCGAHGMCQAAWQVTQAVPGVRAWFSLEAPMACGVGSCQGCVVEGADGGLVKVCRQGPVFPGETVFRLGEPAVCGREEGEA